jgi:hypothetical protein
MPAVWREGRSTSPPVERRNPRAASETTGGDPRRPSCGAGQTVSSSVQIGIAPRRRSAALGLCQCVARWPTGGGLLMRPVSLPGCTL